MKKRLFLLLSAIFLNVSLMAGNIIIAENGRAKADIVIPDKPSTCVKFAAEELKHYLDKITGGSFKITSQPKSEVKIYLGECQQSKQAGLNPEKLKRDGFIISAKGNNIFIAGVDNPSMKKLDLWQLYCYEHRRATLLGVYEFLEQLGVRWPAPGPGHEIVPKRPTLEMPEGTEEIEPYFDDRQIASLGAFMLWKWPYRTEPIFPDATEYCRDTRDIILWGLRMKLSGRYMLGGCHTTQALGLQNIWKKDSEHFALIKGKRNPMYCCWTDPALVEVWKKVADAYFSGKSPSTVGLPHIKQWTNPFIYKNEIMIDPMDGDSTTRCGCKRCNAFRKKYPCSDDTELMWKAIAEIAEYIKEKHPGKYISTLVYPPKKKFPKHIKVPENVRVRICVIGPGSMPIPEQKKDEYNLIKTWFEEHGKRKNPLWTYQCASAFGRKVPGVPETYPHLTAEFLNNTHDYISGMFFEQHALTHTFRNLDAYITARLMWNPNRDIQKELDEYFKIYYGPAAEPAKKLFKRFEDNWCKYWKLVTPNKPESEAKGLKKSPAERRRIVWTKVYDYDEMRNIDSMIRDVEKAAGEKTVYRKRAQLLRKWIFDIMESERAEVMKKGSGPVARVALIKTNPTKNDWKNAPVYKLVSAVRHIALNETSGYFRLLRSNDYLFLKVNLKDKYQAKSKTNKSRVQGNTEVWQDNIIEIYMYSEKSKDLWVIFINDQGVWASQKFNNGIAEWSAMKNLSVRAKPSSKGWIAYAAIPLKQFDGGKLRFNITRNRKAKGRHGELATWSALAKVGYWHNPDYYGTLEFVNSSTLVKEKK